MPISDPPGLVGSENAPTGPRWTGRFGMQIANVKHSHCEAKLGFRVWETKFGHVRRKTSPAAVKYQTLLCCSDVFGLYYKPPKSPLSGGL